MNDSELNSKLDAVSVPEREPDYWETFPGRVRSELRAAPGPQPAQRGAPPRFAWNFARALACVAAAFCICQSRMPRTVSEALLRNEREMRSALSQFPNHVSRLMQDEHGLHRLIEDPQ